jgi:rhamnogalacturonan endolyase
MNRIIATLFSLIVLVATQPTLGDEVLLQDDFSSYRAGLFSSVVGAHTEYHYLPEAAAKGNWAVTNFRSSVPSQRAWRIVEADGERAMGQFYKNKYTFYHPMLISGDRAWQDYTATITMTPQGETGQRGLVFRYRNDRCYYFLGVDGQRAVLKLVNHATAFHKPYEKILAESPLSWTPGDRLRLSVTVDGSNLTAQLGDVSLQAKDTVFPDGQIGIMADQPTLFFDAKVTASSQERNRIQSVIAARVAEEAALQAANPAMKRWKRIDLKDFGVGRNARFGDLDGDGQNDVLLAQVLHHGPKDRNSEVACLTAMTFDGKKLWQVGEPDPWKNHLTNDVAVQIHDLDGDGKTEVIYCKDMKIIVADGATGKTIRSVDTPEMPSNTKSPYDKFPRILGDSLFFCDLRGTGRDADIIIKDRYLSLWALDEDLNILWHAQCNTGHYPYAYDMDDDGKDEVMLGYTLFDDDGTTLWTNDDNVKDHADGVAIVPYKAGAAPRLLCAASDEGMFFADMDGKILKHHYLGHVQNPAIADFRPDLPGLESISINFWGNQGIVHFYDAEGDIYHDFEPAHHGSMCLPVNWTGKPGEFWVLSANVEEGGLFDGWGRRVLNFPADGHPDMANAVLDITGDAREEIVVWDPSEMWVYTQADSPLPHVEFTAVKNPLYNYSNYQTTVSVPRAQSAYTAVDTTQFQDAISHWRKKYGRDRNDPRYAPGQIVEIAENLLRFQNSDGGWPKDLDWLADIDEDVVRTLRTKESMARSTADNHGTFPQIQYLAGVYIQTDDPRHRRAAERGLDYLFREQRPTGGWRGSDVDAITFNDDVMTGIMDVLLEIKTGASHFDWLDDTRRATATRALQRAIECTLACQIVVDGKKTAWGQQHDHETFEPVNARSYELASICSRESAEVLRFLMSLPDADPRIADAIEAGVAWMRETRIEGIRLERKSIAPVRFENHTATFDTIVVADASAPPTWARFYDLEKQEPLFVRRDGTVVETFADINLERRTGYAWYGGWPNALLVDHYAAWKSRK